METRQEQQGVLFPEAAPGGALAINDRCLVRTSAGYRVVVVAGVVLAHYAESDAMAEQHAMVSLVERGYADQIDVARAFGRSARSLRRYQRRFEANGLAGLGRSGGFPRGRSRLRPTRGDRLLSLKADGISNREIAARLGICEKAVRNRLKRLGWRSPPAEQERLPLGEGADPNLSAPHATSESDAPPAAPGADPNLSAFPSPADAAAALPVSFDTDPADRRFDRLFAYLGLLDDAAPLFRDGERVPRAGVLLAIPALANSGVLEIAREVYSNIGPAFYGLRTTLVALVLLALLRIKRPEALKEHSPADLGRILGLDRAPEVKTLRRKLARLAAAGRAADFGRRLAERRVRARADAVGFLYVDGHVRVYHGQRPLPKAHVARMRIALPATTDYWVNDRAGEPLFVVTAEANAGLVRMLPGLLAGIRALVGERRVTVVFDRGGWSPKLFVRMIAEGFDVLTYRKGRCRRVPRRHFQDVRAVLDGREVRYTLADQGIRLRGASLRLRQVTRLTADGHQTPIVTSRRDLPAVEVAFRIFERWRQENFFKYLREEYALDALADYAVEPDDPSREVPNPKWAKHDARCREVRERIQRILGRLGAEQVKAALADAIDAPRAEPDRQLRRELLDAIALSTRLDRRRRAIPRRVPVGSRTEEVVKLATERKHLTNLVKMVAYQAESDLLHRLAAHYRRADDEGRTLVQTALASAADLTVSDGELRVTLAPLSSPHRSRAVAALCEEMTASGVVFPGTRLRLRYAVAEAAAAP